MQVMKLAINGYSHPYPNKLNLEQNIQEIKRTEEVFNENRY